MRTVISCHTSYTFKLLAASTFTVHYEMICSPLFNDPGTSRRWREDDDPAQSPSEFPGAQVVSSLPSSTIRNSVKKLALFQDLMWLDSLCKKSLFPLSSDTQLFSHFTAPKEGRVSGPRETCGLYKVLALSWGVIFNKHWTMMFGNPRTGYRLTSLQCATSLGRETEGQYLGNSKVLMHQNVRKHSAVPKLRQHWIASALECTERASSNGSSSFGQFVNGVKPNMRSHGGNAIHCSALNMMSYHDWIFESAQYIAI